MPSQPQLMVLVVDDHTGFRRIAKQICEDNGMVVIEAASGEEAVTLFAAKHPDWVLMDLRMPGLGGIRATRKIRGLDPKARVIVISQLSSAEYREQALQAGAVDFLAKEDLGSVASVMYGTRHSV